MSAERQQAVEALTEDHQRCVCFLHVLSLLSHIVIAQAVRGMRAAAAQTRTPEGSRYLKRHMCTCSDGCMQARVRALESDSATHKQQLKVLIESLIFHSHVSY